MMTKQAELKKRAYASDLKSRALSILIYLIDRSNKELTCFPAIPTMAEQLHISISPVKRALHELVDAGFIQKDSRFRESNRGQTSNLYTLVFREETPEPTPETDYNPDCGDHIEPATQSTSTGEYKAERITFATIAAEVKQEQTALAMQETSPELIASSTLAPTQMPKVEQSHTKPTRPVRSCTPVHFAFPHRLKLPPVPPMVRENVRQFLSCGSHSFMWTGAGVNLIPP